MNLLHAVLISVPLVAIGAVDKLFPSAFAADKPTVDVERLLDISDAYRTGVMSDGHPDWDKASQAYLAATEHGSASGAFFVGWALSNGKLDFRDHKLAAKYYELSLSRLLEQGKVARNTSYNLGVLYVRGGHGLKKDIPKGIAHMRYAALHGSGAAASFFAWAFDRGIGPIKPDPMKSVVWAHIAYASDNAKDRKLAEPYLRKAKTRLKQIAYRKAVACFQEDVYESCL